MLAFQPSTMRPTQAREGVEACPGRNLDSSRQSSTTERHAPPRFVSSDLDPVALERPSTVACPSTVAHVYNKKSRNSWDSRVPSPSPLRSSLEPSAPFPCTSPALVTTLARWGALDGGLCSATKRLPQQQARYSRVCRHQKVSRCCLGTLRRWKWWTHRR